MKGMAKADQVGERLVSGDFGAAWIIGHLIHSLLECKSRLSAPAAELLPPHADKNLPQHHTGSIRSPSPSGTTLNSRPFAKPSGRTMGKASALLDVAAKGLAVFGEQGFWALVLVAGDNGLHGFAMHYCKDLTAFTVPMEEIGEHVGRNLGRSTHWPAPM